MVGLDRTLKSPENVDRSPVLQRLGPRFISLVLPGLARSETGENSIPHLISTIVFLSELSKNPCGQPHWIFIVFLFSNLFFMRPPIGNADPLHRIDWNFYSPAIYRFGIWRQWKEGLKRCFALAFPKKHKRRPSLFFYPIGIDLGINERCISIEYFMAQSVILFDMTAELFGDFPGNHQISEAQPRIWFCRS